MNTLERHGVAIQHLLPSLAATDRMLALQLHHGTVLFGDTNNHISLASYDALLGVVHDIVKDRILAGLDGFRRAIDNDGTVDLYTQSIHRRQYRIGNRSRILDRRGKDTRLVVDLHGITNGRILLGGPNTEEAPVQLSRLIIKVRQTDVVLVVQLQLSVIPPGGIGTDIDGTEQSHASEVEGSLHLGHAIMMGLGGGGINTLLSHQRRIGLLGEGKGHPEMRIGIELPGLGRQLRGVLRTQGLQHESRNGEGAETGPDLTDVAEAFQHLDGRGMIDLLHLGGIASLALGHGNDAVLVQPLFGPFLGRGGRVAEEGAHDVDVVGGGVREGGRGDEDLVAPEDREAALAGRGINARLLDDRLQDGHGLERPITQLVADGKFHARLVVVLTGGQRSKTGALAGRVIQSSRDLALTELLVEVHSVLLLGKLGGLGVGVQRSQAVAGAAGRPILGNGEDEGEGRVGIGRRRGVTNPLGEAFSPVRRLVVIGGADDGDVVQGRILGIRHDGEGGFEGFLLHFLLGGGGHLVDRGG
mmetsp:Transcript_25024/g.58559  ORF Transcript_25024/g.58559 Transcript_25024/m.58559 type:complete len:529 (+) Transcript_25024:211-1797(+)